MARSSVDAFVNNSSSQVNSDNITLPGSDLNTIVVDGPIKTVHLENRGGVNMPASCD